MNLKNTIIQQTQCWLKSIIIDLNFCPFANKEFKKGRIRYSVSDATDLESNLHSLAEELNYLDNHNNTETTLLIFSHYAKSFDDFLDLIDYANQLLDELNYRAVYQLAHFHPQYAFDGVTLDDASNYTNRAPYPSLHLLREKSLHAAIENHPNTAEIPETNIKLARKLGADKIQSRLNNCIKKS